MCNRPHFCSFLFNFPIIALVNICFLLTSSAQTFSLQHYTTENGIPGTTIYSVDQDEFGYLWLATDGGICRFNGQNFELFKNENLRGEVTLLKFDSQGRLWMIDLANKVYMYQNGEVSRYDQYFKNQKINHLFEDQEQNIWLCFERSVSKMTNIQPNTLPDTTNLNNPFFYERMLPVFLRDSTFAIISAKGINHFKNGKFTSSPYSVSRQQLFDDFNLVSFPYSAIQANENIYFSGAYNVFSLDLDKKEIKPAFESLQQKFNLGVNRIFSDEDENVWVTTRSGVHYIQMNEDGSYKNTHLLKGINTSRVFQDDEKNIWVISPNGIYKISSIKIKIYQNENPNEGFTAVKPLFDDLIITADIVNTIKILDENFNLKEKKRLSPRNERIYDFDLNNEQTELTIAANIGLVKLDIPIQQSIIENKFSGLKTSKYGPDGKIWFGSYNFAGYAESGFFKKILKKRTYAILPLIDNKAWIGTVEGLYFCNDTICNKVKNELLQQDIRDIKEDSNKTLWLATQADGVVLFNDGIIKHITTKDGLAGDHCQKLLLDKEFAWVATTRGISKINLTDFSIKNITTANGLPADNIYDLSKRKNKIYAATNKGLAVFEDNFEIYSKPPVLSIKSLQINNVDTLLQDFYKLPHTSNNIHFKFNSSSFKNTQGLEYLYQLKGLDDSWVSTTFSEANFPSLPPGDYSFFVKTKTPNSDWSKEKTVSFFIEKPYWQKSWFYALVFLLFFLTGALFFYALIKEFKRRNEVQKKLMESQLTALRAQMNPHFLFNSLNSIQEFIITNDKRSANYYLSRFSRLVRNILNTSSKNEIRLKKEIETLQLYLDLEALRFEKNFEHVFEIDKNLDLENIYIPSMLIQPYVENAIKHGLMHKEGMKKLFVRFFKNENTLVCEVEDNGIGRDRAKKIQKQNQKIYQSKAMILTKERLDLINSSGGGILNLDIIDLKNENNKPTGTKIIIQVQIKLKK